MKIIDTQLLDQISAQARENQRLRKNYNIHPSDDFCCHRLLNAVEPGSYIAPHRHLDPNKDETFAILRGRLGIVTFDDAGAILQTTVLAAGGNNIVADIPHGIYHTAVSLEHGTVFFEAKAGPYLPLSDDEKAPWAPADGTVAAVSYLSGLVALF